MFRLAGARRHRNVRGAGSSFGGRFHGPVPTANLVRTANSSESSEASPDGRALQTNLVCGRRTVSLARRIGSRESGASPQLNILRRKSPKRPTLGGIDRLVFAGLHDLAPVVLSALAIVRPETVIRWHRASFRLYWRWRSKSLGGRPKLPAGIRQLIRDMSVANPLWGAPKRLRQGLYPTSSGDGYPESANRAAITVAERLL